MSNTIGYARMSKNEQNPAAQEAELHAEGRSIAHIANVLGVGASSVSRALARLDQNTEAAAADEWRGCSSATPSPTRRQLRSTTCTGRLGECLSYRTRSIGGAGAHRRPRHPCRHPQDLPSHTQRGHRRGAGAPRQP